jgi:peptide/nickel transport system permease protein
MDALKKKELQLKGVNPSIQHRAIRKMLNNKLAILGLVVFIVILILCYIVPFFVSYSPTKINLSQSYNRPSFQHLFGTDRLGRDVFSRVLSGGKISIAIGLGSAIGASIIGVILGSYGGYVGGIFDYFFLRLSELFLFFPQTILVLLLVMVTGQSIGNLMFIFIITGWCSTYRMIRAQVMSIREQDFVQALKVQGIGTLRICYKHILPNTMAPVFVNITLNTATFILQESALSYLGLGVPLEIPTWGSILNVANNFEVLLKYWWIWLPVGCFISFFVLAVNFIGDGLRDSTNSSQQG